MKHIIVLLFAAVATVNSQCPFDRLQLPFGAVVSGGSGGVTCTSLGVVAHAASCVFTRPNFNCDVVTCGLIRVGEWNTNTPGCRSTSVCSQPCVRRGECRGTGTCQPTTGLCDDPVLPDGTVCSQGFCSGGVCTSGQVQPVPPPSGTDSCIAFRASIGCSSQGVRDVTRDLSCLTVVPTALAGYCECRTTTFQFNCGHGLITCRDICGCTPGVSACPQASVCHNPGVCSSITRECTSSVKPDGTACSPSGGLNVNTVHTCQLGVCSPVTGGVSTLYNVIDGRNDATIYFKILSFAGVTNYVAQFQSLTTMNTLLVPADSAFASMSLAERNRLTNDDGFSGDISSALQFIAAHLVPGKLVYDALPQATHASLLGVTVFTKNLPAVNGYVNMIGRVLPYLNAPVTPPTPPPVPVPVPTVPVPPPAATTTLALLKGRQDAGIFAKFFETVLTNNPQNTLINLNTVNANFYTIFAPNDAAMVEYGITNANYLQSAVAQPALAYYHVIFGQRQYSDLLATAPQVLASLDGGRQITTEVSTVTNALLLDGRSSVAGSVASTTSLIHIIDKVMVHSQVGTPPAPVPAPLRTLAQIIGSEAQLTSFHSYLQSSSVFNELFPFGANGNPEQTYTIFAPTNAALAQITSGVAGVLNSLQRTLRHHVVDGGVRFGTGGVVIYDNKIADLRTRAGNAVLLLPTRDAAKVLQIVRNLQNNGILVNGRATVTQGDVLASDGIIHIIDYPLVPSDLVGVQPSPPSPFVPVPGVPTVPVPFTPPATGSTVLTVLATYPQLSSFRALLYNTRNDVLITSNANVFPMQKQYTVFAPTNEAMAAFNTFSASNTFNSDLIVKNHLSSLGSVVIQQALQQGSVGVLSGRALLIRYQNGYFVEDPYYGASNQGASLTAVSTPDIIADDGVVHVIDRVLILTNFGATTPLTPGTPFTPGTPSQFFSVYDLLASNVGGSFSSFLALVVETDMDDILRLQGVNNVYTLFAPDNTAFAKEGINVQEAISRSKIDANTRNEMIRFVRTHVTNGYSSGLFYSNNVNTNFRKVMRTLDNSNLGYSGGFVTLDGTTQAGNTARVISAESQANNGLLYRIDNLILPEGLNSLRFTNTNPAVTSPLPFTPPVWNPVPVPGTVPSYTWPPVPTVYNPVGVPSQYSVAYLIQNDPELTDFSLLLASNALLPMVTSDIVTVFAVSNSGLRSGGVGNVNSFNNGNNNNIFPALAGRPPHEVQAILRNHILPGRGLRVDALLLDNQGGWYTAERQRLLFTLIGANAYVNNYLIRRRDIVGTNGVLHIIDVVLLPSLAPTSPNYYTGCSGGQTVCSVISQKAELRDFYVLLSTHGILNELNGAGPYTVLAPTNAAVLAATPLISAQSVTSLQQMLREHIVVGQSIPSSQLSSSVLQSTFGNNFNPVFLVQRDLPATNGVVHVVNTFLVRATNTGPAPPPGVPPPFTYYQPPPVPQLTFNSQCTRESVCGVLSVHSELNIFASFLKSIGSPSLLQGLGVGSNTLGNVGNQYTVFAPSNTAFESLPTGVQAMLASSPQSLESILKYHIVSHARINGGDVRGISEAELPQMSPLQPIGGGSVTAIRTEGGQQRTQINTNAVIVIPDQSASNGVVHVISSVLIPNTNTYFNSEFPSQSVMASIESVPRFSGFVKLLNTAELAFVLRGTGPFTVFPVDNSNLLPLFTEGGALAGAVNDKVALRSILTRHIFNGYYNSSVIMGGGRAYATVDGSTVTVAPGGIPEGEDLTGAWLDYVLRDVYATNGIVHSVTAVLTKGADTPPPPPTPGTPNNGPASPTPVPTVDAVCTNVANCSGFASKQFVVSSTNADGVTVPICVCDCIARYAGLSCEQCAEGFTGHPACVEADATTPTNSSDDTTEYVPSPPLPSTPKQRAPYPAPTPSIPSLPLWTSTHSTSQQRAPRRSFHNHLRGR